MVNGAPEQLPDTGLELDAQGPDLRSLLVRALSRSLAGVIGLTVLGGAIGLWLGIAQPNLYASNTKLLLRVGAREMVSSESMIGSDSEPRLSTPTMVDEMQMLQDAAIFGRVAGAVGPQEILRPADPARDDGPATPLHVALMHQFQRGLFGSPTPDHPCSGVDCGVCLPLATKQLESSTTITNELGSNVINVNFVSTSPDKARAIAQALADAFIERHREQFSIQALVEKNRGKVEDALRERNDAATEYIEQVNTTSISESETLSPAYVLELNALEKDLFDATVQLEQIRRKRSSLSERAKDEPAGDFPSGPLLMIPNQQYETQLELKRNLVSQKRNLAATDLEGAHALDTRIAEIDELLSRMPKTVSLAPEHRQGVAAPPSAGRLEFEIEENALVVKVQMLTERYAVKKAAADEVRKRGLLADLKRKDLASARDNAENRYRQMQDRFSVLEALSAIDINEDANLRVLQAPTVASDKVGPKRVSLVLKGLIAGLLAGALFAVLRQHFDTRLRYPELFERVHGLPVLGVVPQLGSLRRLPRVAAGERS